MKLTPFAKFFVTVVILAVVGYAAYHYKGRDIRKWATGSDKGQTELGIYQFDGDTVKLCINEKGKDRPKEFTTAADNQQNLVVLKRQK